MPRLHRTRYLSCFYCGRRSSIANDGKTRRFDCPNCDATNYLDADGQITDPPVATDAVATPAKFAVPRTAQSPPSSPTGAIFCDTCLTNQHLLRASLAQYLPDPDDPEYYQREKDFYRFRNAQEKRYPQICAACEPKVRQRLQQAAYTAKTDVLRRIIDRSAHTRNKSSGGGLLKLVGAVGRFLWVLGFVLQLCWHLSVLETLYLESDQAIQIDDSSWTLGRVFVSVTFLLEPIPATTFIQWSSLASLLGIWWNPRLAQVLRGFTKHINGIHKWYFYQCTVVAIRFYLQKARPLTDPRPSRFQAQLAGHVLLMVSAILMFILGACSIRIDMTPLFKPSQPVLIQDHPEPQPQPQPKNPSPPSSKLDETKSISELLDEISRSPPSNRSPSPVSDQETPFRPRQPRPRPQRSFPSSTSTVVDLDDLAIPPRPAASQYSDEMDWSPTQSRHRAFNAAGQRSTPAAGFNASPTSPDRGPFWYRVPPAPISPAQRVTTSALNPPFVRPVAASQSANPFGGASRVKVTDPSIGSSSGAKGEEESTKARYRGVNFREARFFPPANKEDPRNSLLDMFGQTLSFGEEEEAERREREAAGTSTGTRSWWKGFRS